MRPCTRSTTAAKSATLAATLRLLPSRRPSLHIRVQSFGRFDEITYLVEKTAALTLPDLGRSALDSVAAASLRYPAPLADWPGLLSGRSPHAPHPSARISFGIASVFALFCSLRFGYRAFQVRT